MAIGHDVLVKLLTEKKLDVFYKLDRRLFSEVEVGSYDEILDYIKSYRTLPAEVTNVRSLQNETPRTEPLEYLLDELANRNFTIKIPELGNELGRLLGKSKGIEAFNLIQKFVGDSLKLRARESARVFTLADLGTMVAEHIDATRGMHGTLGVPSGWPSLDNQLFGFQGGNLYLFVARPKMGKTMVMIQLANKAFEAGYTPMVLSMEMSALEMGKRQFALRNSFEMRSVLTGQLSSEAQYILSDDILTIEERPNTMYLIEGQFQSDTSELRETIKDLRPDVLIIDGGYLLSTKMPGMRNPSSWERVTEVAKELKLLASQEHIPVIASYQFNRGAVDKTKRGYKPGVENIQLSDALGQIASGVISIQEDEEDLPRRRLDLIAAREGQPVSWFIDWNWQRMEFEEQDDALMAQFEGMTTDDQDVILERAS